jgi:membrane fusion protein (multidrug efflux system)
MFGNAEVPSCAGRVIACLLCGAAWLAGCSKEAPPPAARVADVTAMTITARDAPAVFEFVGQTQSSREVEIRARVDGFLDKRVYTEGGLVREGQTLFLMDRKPFEAALQQARGELAQQQAKLQVAEANLARVKPLAEQNAVSKKDLDDAVGNEKSARAAVLSAEGGIRQAELNLSYATITTPLTGLSSSARIQEGAYVNASNNLLTTVAQLDPMWVNFSVSENNLLRLRQSVSKGELKVPDEKKLDVEVVLADGTVYQNRGKISFADPSFSKETGTFLVRATFANPLGALKPGQFVRVHVLGATRPNAILVPQRAVQQGAKSHFVWVVGKDGKAEQRAVVTGEWSGDDWVISHGLSAGEQVVVDGAIRVAPGASLKVTPHKTAEGAAPATPKKAADPTPVERERGLRDRPSKPGAARGPAGKDASATWPVRVHFAYRKVELDEAAKDAIAAVTAALKGGTGRVGITGYADQRGSPERNRKFAEERAHAVRDALIAGGVAADRIEMKRPEQVVGSGTDAEARRVEIAFAG